MSPRFIAILAAACAVALLASTLAWIRDNPLPAYFDEAVYAESAIIDAWEATHNGVRGIAISLLTLDPSRPPAHRLLALPLTLIAGPALVPLRIYSLLMFFAAALLLADAVRRVTGVEAATVSFLLAIGSPVLILATRMFGTEYPLLFALALLVWSLERRNWPAAGVAIGLGVLAKMSFFAAAGPMLAVAFFLSPRWPSLPRRSDLLKATLLAMAISILWWAHDPLRPLHFTSSSAAFVRHRLGPLLSAKTALLFSWEMIRTGPGIGVAFLLLVTLVTLRWRDLDERRKAFAAVAAAGALLTPVLTYTSHNPRHGAPGLFVLCSAAAVVMMPRLRTIAVFIAAAQIAVIAMPRAWTPADARGSLIRRGPAELMAPVEQWDWTPLRAFADRLRAERPSIAILGEGYAFNAPQIRYAWQRVERDVPVHTLYRWDLDPPFVLSRAVEGASHAQIVVTAPGFHGEPSDGQLPSNRYNDLFAATLARDPRFAGPFPLDVGSREPAVVAVFVRR
jgi:hypothetical protein